MNNGFFITFEGGEGSGKSTQSNLLYEYLLDAGHQVIITREPGGSEGAEIIRELLVHGESDRWKPLSELFLFSAARVDHIARTINPALNEGKIVICDRYIDSTTAYQGIAGNIDKDIVSLIQDLTVKTLIPDLTYICDLDPVVGLERALNRNIKENRYELKGIEFHQRIRSAFIDIAKTNKNRCIIVDANRDLKEISKSISNQFETTYKK
ncbi:MAG: dTMP kinase [Alphaproteobacteria bacterium]|jgi:dTMP kinase|tara:strand:- start:43019 stop:43648 length:630 start_codon:yes stop_codon:yes gene_type:complete